MKPNTVAAIVALSFLAGTVLAQRVADRKDLHAAEVHLHQVVNELERAAQANHYDMNGHAGKAIQLAKQAEQEIHIAWESAAENTSR